MTAASTPAAGLRLAALPLAWCALLFLSAVLLQLLASVPFDADTAYHVAVARLIASHGILHSFPWTPFSWLADHYADKELLFHLLLVPFSSLDASTDAKIVGSVCGALLLCAVYLILRSEKADHPELWSLLLLTASGYFVMRLALVRPHVLAVALALVVTWAAAHRRYALLVAVCFAYPFAYVAWQTPLILVVIVEIARALARLRPSPRPIALAAAGLGAGVLVHPNFPQEVSLFWVQNVDVLRAAWTGKSSLDLGTEFERLTVSSFLRQALVPYLLVVAGGAFAWRRRRESFPGAVYAAAAVAFSLLALLSVRFIEYLVPFAVVSAAVASRGLLPSFRGGVSVVAAVLAGSFGYTAALGSEPIRLLASRLEDIPTPVAQALRQEIPAGSQVFTCDWGLTGALMLALPDRRFLVALDPTFFWKKDPALYELWSNLVRNPPPHPTQIIRDRFGARFVLCNDEARWAPFLRAVFEDGGVRRYSGPLWFLAELSPSD